MNRPCVCMWMVYILFLKANNVFGMPLMKFPLLMTNLPLAQVILFLYLLSKTLPNSRLTFAKRKICESGAWCMRVWLKQQISYSKQERQKHIFEFDFLHQIPISMRLLDICKFFEFPNCIASHLNRIVYFFVSKLLLWCVLHCIHLEAKIHLNFFHFVHLHLFLFVCLFYWIKCDGYLNTLYQLKNKCSSYVVYSIVLHRNHFKSIQWRGSLAIYWSNQLNVQ